MVRTAFCFDLDGTVTAEEILPVLARQVDLHEEIVTLTQVTMDGLIPFEQSFKLRVKLLSPILISDVRNQIIKIKLQQDVVDFIQKNVENCFIVTGNLDVWIEGLVDKIGCKSFSSKAHFDGDRLLGIENILNKGNAIEEIRKSFDRIVVVGDGMNDTPMFERADVRIAYGGVHAPVETLIKYANYVTYSARGLCNILNTLS